jgi:2-polyprenyl-3-methyl-5-hydroxy-6-metoxy-1,4-benzoquinol methylase
MSNREFLTADNHGHWEQLASFHGTGQDDFYDLDILRRGGTLMGDDEMHAIERAVGGHDLSGLSGLKVAHLQSHIGADAITMARAGANVTAIDFSKTALQRACALADECGVTIDAVEADSRDLPLELNEQFDLVYASIGVLYWIDSVDAWMQSVARVLKPGGHLVLVEIHPVLSMVGSTSPLVTDFPYGGGKRVTYSGTGTYAKRDADVSWSIEGFAHSVGEVVTAAITAGLTVSWLEEHTETQTYTGSCAVKESDGQYRLRLGSGSEVSDADIPGECIPLLFSLIAAK